jgi:hypothetical protein
MPQQAIAKAVEVSTADTFIINTDGADQTINPSQNLFPNIFALIADLNDQITLTGAALSWVGQDAADSFSITANRVEAYISAAGDTITDIAGTLAPTLGFTGNETPDTSGSASFIVANYPPEEVWLPTYHTSDQSWFNEKPGEVFKGARGTDGNLSGIAYTARRHRMAEWPWEHGENAIENADPNPATGNSTANKADRLAYAARSFSKVINDARSMVLAQSGSNNLYCKGVYFIEDLDLYGTTVGALPATWDSGSVEFDSTGLLSNYVFCSCGPPQINGASSDISRRYYDLALDLTTAVAPAWGWDIS